MTKEEKELEFEIGFNLGKNMVSENRDLALSTRDTLRRAKQAREENGGPEDEDHWNREGCLAGIEEGLKTV